MARLVLVRLDGVKLNQKEEEEQQLPEKAAVPFQKPDIHAELHLANVKVSVRGQLARFEWRRVEAPALPTQFSADKR